jgi:hypothetical protein
MTNLETISTVDLSSVSGGADQQAPGDYSANGSNVVQQGGQMIDNAVSAYQGARKAGASWYESVGNAAIGFFNLGGGFGRDGRPR